MQPYLDAILLVLAVAGMGLVMTLLPSLVGTRRPRARKSQPYECGVPLQEEAHRPFSIHFYLVAMVFILFDIEVAFLIPWAVVARELGWAGLVQVGVFLSVLALGLAYLYRERVLEGV